MSWKWNERLKELAINIILCPVTLLMHLAAAVEVKGPASRSRPCVVVAGGREAPHWAAYPTHQFIHTVGTLACCAQGGCWRVRTVPLGDGDYRDGARYLCLDVVDGLPRCMDLIEPAHAIRAVELYGHGAAAERLSPRLDRPAAKQPVPDRSVQKPASDPVRSEV